MNTNPIGQAIAGNNCSGSRFIYPKTDEKGLKYCKTFEKHLIRKKKYVSFEVERDVTTKSLLLLR